MMRRLAEDASHIFLATGATDFRKQIPGLAAVVSMQFKLDPFEVRTGYICIIQEKPGSPYLCKCRRKFLTHY